VVIHDRLAMYWKLKQAKHGVCSAHLLRDLTASPSVHPNAAGRRVSPACSSRSTTPQTTHALAG